MNDPVQPILAVRNLTVQFPLRRRPGQPRRHVHAVRGVSLDIAPGETLGLIGESGCGKSTLARAIVRLAPITSGEVYLAGNPWHNLPERRLRPLRPAAQMIFQDPWSSLNPRMRIGRIIEEPLIVQKRGDRDERQATVARVLEQVGLHPDDAGKYPHQFSGGQRQRIGIARALVLEPQLLLADEAVSALDVSVQAQILNLLADLRAEHRFSMLFISHDLRVVEQVSDRIAVMYLGKIVELGSPEDVLDHSRHPYTRALVEAVPEIDARGRRRVILGGEPPSPINPPRGCAFAGRCPRAQDRCHTEDAVLTGDDHQVACHYPLTEDPG
ncbi:MAG: ABC transporter ATP-binding protein [Candidatus Dadabacteria bacterium]|nr:MAG: ABC transporter ATP-binding protein [Candidatus Dadabacteria bacterium]